MSRARILLAVVVFAIIAATVAWAQQPVNVLQVNSATPPMSICENGAQVSSFNINLSAGTGNTEIVALSGSNVIYVCGFALIVGGADGTQWITGTGTACATGETDKATFNFAAAGDGIALSGGNNGQMFATAAGGALCLERTNSVTVSGIVWYVQRTAVT